MTKLASSFWTAKALKCGVAGVNLQDRSRNTAVHTAFWGTEGSDLWDWHSLGHPVGNAVSCYRKSA